MEKINLKDKFKLFNEFWSPKIIGELNGQYIKLAKLKGEIVWHSHEEEDECFLVIKGVIKILFRNGEVELKEGECFIVPRGVEHKPVAEEEAHVLLFEPRTTAHTGSVKSDQTVEIEEQNWI